MFFGLIVLTACGVKGDPVAPKNEPTPSILENYPDIKVNAPLDETKGIRRARSRK